MTIADCENQMEEIKVKRAQLCKTKKVVEAITILKQLNEKHEAEAKKLPLLDEATDSAIFLQVHMKKIPPKKMIKRIHVPLPHSMVTDTTEICLFTGDLDKRNKKAEVDPDVLHYKELLKKQGITKINEVITLRQLRTEYKVFEARRKLMAAYDVFLADKKIAQCLPKLLGKGFIKKRKFPIQIAMNANLKSQIDTALSKTVFTVTCRGNTCTSEVARLGMEDDKILENVLASVKVIADQLPGEQNNIAGIYVKTAKSLAIPIFLSFGNPNEVKIEKPYKREKVQLEELSTQPNTKVKVFRDGRIFVKRTRGTEDNPEGVEESEPHHGKRKRESDKGINDDLEGESSAEIEELESMVADIEEDTNKSKSKKKRKLNEKNKVQEAMESGVTELKVEDLENGLSSKKTKSKKKRKSIVENEAAQEVESREPEDSSKASPKKGKAKSVVENIEEDTNKSASKKKRKLREKNKAQNAVESGLAAAVEKDTSPSKTKSKKKSKTTVENEAVLSLEPEDSIKAISEKLKVKSKIDGTEEDTSVIKTRLRSRGSVKKSSPKGKNTKKGAKNV